jgi:hypothetical protein
MVLFISSPAWSAVESPIVSPVNGHTYYLLADNQAWTTAEATAESLGGHLATIRSAAENTWIVNTFDGADHELWIGLNDLASSRTFTWISGEVSTYTNWGPGEPNNQTPPEDYVQIRWPGAVAGNLVGTWNDTSVDAHGFPCYGVAEVVPEPVTLSLLALGGLAMLRRRANHHANRS